MPWVQLRAPYALIQGRRYAAEVRLPDASSVAARLTKNMPQASLIKLRLETAGFYGVTVDMTRGPRVEGVWGEKTQAGFTTLPAEVRSVWEWQNEDHKR